MSLRNCTLRLAFDHSSIFAGCQTWTLYSFDGVMPGLGRHVDLEPDNSADGTGTSYFLLHTGLLAIQMMSTILCTSCFKRGWLEIRAYVFMYAPRERFLEHFVCGRSGFTECCALISNCDVR